jgi:hypothetical protein
MKRRKMSYDEWLEAPYQEAHEEDNRQEPIRDDPPEPGEATDKEYDREMDRYEKQFMSAPDER